MTGLAVTFALLSATAAACATSLQHQAAELAPAHVTGVWALIRHLVRQPLWVFGQVLGLATLAFHGLALNHGPITLVQPLVVSGIVLAVPLRAAIERRLPRGREMRALFVAAAGLAVFLVVSAPSTGRRAGLGPTSVTLVLGCGGVGLLALISARRVHDITRRAFLLGAAAGIFFALVAVLLKMSLSEFSAGGISGVLLTWPPYALVAAGLGGVLGNQLAYRSARLSSSMPVLNVVDCLLALACGYLLFHEVPRHTPGALALEALALIGMLTGLYLLARDAAEDLDAPLVTHGATPRNRSAHR